MSSSEFLKNYDLAGGIIRRLYDSRLRLTILDALKDRPMRLADLRRAVNANAPNTSSKAKELEEMGLVERVEGDFRLTPYGRVTKNRIEEMLKFHAAYEKFKEFWETHDLSGIPDHLLARIGDLLNTKVVKNESMEPQRVHQTYLNFLESIKQKCYATTAIYMREYFLFASKLVNKGVDMQVIVTPGVLKKSVNDMPQAVLKTLANSENLRLFVLEWVPLDINVAEKAVSFNLKTKKGELLFMDQDMRSTDPRAIKWGLDLFEYYKKQAKPVKLSDYL